jgi:Transposase and inactivated derivatives
MVDKQKIIHMYRTCGYSKRKIARDLDISRKTVHKVIAEYESALQSPDPESSLESVLTTHPRYNTSNRDRRKIVGSLKEMIDDCLEKNARKRAMGLRKQCMLGKDIYELLIEKGFQISYPSVSKYIASVNKQKQEKKSEEAFIRGYYPPGETCEFDWGEVKLYIAGKLQRLYLAIFTFSHSNGRYAWLFRHQNTLAFMESHRNFFRQVEGVPSMMVYDNMRVAIKEFVGVEKKPTDAMLRMSNFYRFHYRFCNVRAGWEKGHVERSVEYVRRKAFSLKLHFSTVEDAQKQLSSMCEKINNQIGSVSTVNKVESHRADLAALTPCINEMGCFEVADYKVSKWATICMKTSHYSVPDTLVGKIVTVKIYSEKLIILSGNKKVAVHERIYTNGGWSVKLEHYAGTLLRKPGALGSSLAFKQMPEKIQALFNKHFKEKPKDFVLLLQYATENGFTDNDMIDAYKSLIERGLRNVSADQIKAMMHVGKEREDTNFTIVNPETSKDESSQIEDGAVKILQTLSNMMETQNNITVSIN